FEALTNLNKAELLGLSDLLNLKLVDRVKDMLNSSLQMLSSPPHPLSAASQFPTPFSQIHNETIDQYVERKKNKISNELTFIVEATNNESPAKVVNVVNKSIKQLREDNKKFKINRIDKSKKGAI